MHAVRTQCKVLDVGKYSNPTFGPFSQVFGSIPGFFWLPKHFGCGTKTLVHFKVILEPRCSRSSIGMATSTTAEKSTWSSPLEGSRSPILDDCTLPPPQKHTCKEQRKHCTAKHHSDCSLEAHLHKTQPSSLKYQAVHVQHPPWFIPRPHYVKV